MVNDARAEWQAFRRYNYPHIEVKEEPSRIEFKQVSGSNKAQVWGINLAIFAVFVIIFFSLVSGGRDSKDWGLIFLFFGGISAGTLMALVPRWAKRWNTLDITPGHVRIVSGDKNFDISTENIRAVEVRPSQHVHGIYLWDGPVAIYVFAMFNDADAIAIRNGIEAGIVMMNPSVVAAQPTVGGPPTRRSFAE